MGRWLLLYFLWLGWVLPVAAQTVDDGDKKYLQGDYLGALADYTAILQREPQNITALINRGLVYNQLRRYPEAIRDYTQAIALKPDAIAAYSNRCVLYTNLKDYDAALPDCDQAVRLAPSNGNYFLNRCVVQRGKQNYDAARRDCEEALRLGARGPVQYRLGEIAQDQGRHDEAITAFTLALEKEKNPLFYLKRGNSYYQKDQYDQALADYDQALALRPNYLLANLNRVVALNTMKNHTQAVTVCQQQTLTGKEESQAIGLFYYFCGNARLATGDLDTALQNYTQAIGAAPTLQDVYLNRARVYFTRPEATPEQLELALQDCAQALTQAPNSDGAFALQGAIYLALGKTTEALASFDRALALGYDQPDIYLYRGSAYRKEEKWTEAIADFTKVLAQNPTLAEARLNRGLSYLIINKLPEAIADLTVAIEESPSVLAYTSRATAYYSLGKYKEARADFLVVAERAPTQGYAFLGTALASLELKKTNLPEITSYLTQALGKSLPREEKTNALLALSALQRQEKKRDLALATLREANALVPGLADCVLKTLTPQNQDCLPTTASLELGSQALGFLLQVRKPLPLPPRPNRPAPISAPEEIIVIKPKAPTLKRKPTDLLKQLLGDKRLVLKSSPTLLDKVLTKKLKLNLG